MRYLNFILFIFFSTVLVAQIDSPKASPFAKLEQDIPTIQWHIKGQKLTYEKLVRYFLYRIYLFELDSSTSLHTMVDFNENVLEEVRQLQKLENCQRDINNSGISYLFQKNIIKT